jgi:hypothetical protein
MYTSFHVFRDNILYHIKQLVSISYNKKGILHTYVFCYLCKIYKKKTAQFLRGFSFGNF